jgi:hypothetical protein
LRWGEGFWWAELFSLGQRRQLSLPPIRGRISSATAINLEERLYEFTASLNAAHFRRASIHIRFLDTPTRFSSPL